MGASEEEKMAAEVRLTEDIKYLIELLRLIWLSLIAVSGGTIGLLLGELTTRRLWFAGIGIVGMILLTTALAYLHRQIKSLIPQLGEV